MSQQTHPLSPNAGRGQLLTVERAAEYLSLAPSTLRNWISMKRIEHVKVGRLTRLAQAALDRYIATHTIRAVDERDDHD